MTRTVAVGLWRGLAVCVIVALFSACAVQPRDGAAHDASASDAARGQVDQVQHFSGRVAVVTQGNATHDKQRALNARFDLTTVDGRAGELMLATPLGNTVAKVDWSPVSARITDNYGEVTIFPHFATMMEHVAGVAIEPKQLLAWLRADVSDDSELSAVDGVVGWQLDMSDYDAQVRTGKIKAVRHAADEAVTRVTLIVE